MLQTTHLSRFHDDTTTVGPLTANTNSRPQIAAAWYDGIGRGIASAAYGTHGGTTFIRPQTIPQRSETCLVSSVSYNNRGESEFTTDPGGIITQQKYDDAGRLTARVEQYDLAHDAALDKNITTQFTYNADGRQASVTALNTQTGHQRTRYEYGVTVAGGSRLVSNDLLREVVYPGTGATTVRYAYDRTGARTSLIDQNGTVHQYAYDALGRLLSDEAKILASGLDGAVRKLGSTYNARGLVTKLTSYNGAGGIVNEVQHTYNGLDLLTAQAQSHAGAVSGGTPQEEGKASTAVH